MMFPARSIEVDGSYRLLVSSSEFNNVRKYLLKYLQPLYEQYVEPDARPNPQRYAGPPQVSPLESDEYSYGEQSYMTISVNTALSYASALSDEEGSVIDHTEPSFSGQKPPIPTHVNKPTWAEEAASRSSSSAKSSGGGTQSRTNPTNNDDLVSDLASSRAEVEELKAQMAQLHEDKQRTDALIADTVKQQVAQALQTHLTAIVEESTISQNQFATFTESQNRRFDDLVALFRQQVSHGNNSQTTSAKRGIPDDEESVQMEDSPSITPSETSNRSTKRVDDRGTPNQNESVLDHMQDLNISEKGCDPLNLLSEFKTPERKNSRQLNSLGVDRPKSSARSGSKNQSVVSNGTPTSSNN